MTAMKDMDCIILCGGLGTRLREETEFKPKPMIEIGGRPILWHIMKHYHHFGVRSFILCLGYRGDVVREYFLNYQTHNSDLAVDFRTGTVETLSNGYDEDWRVVLADTGADTLTGSRILGALRYVRGDRFLATYGDGVATVDLDRLVMHHAQAGKPATVTAVRPSSRYGELSIEDGMVTSFIEKPQVATGWINGGYFVFEKSAFAHLEPHENVTLEDAVLGHLARAGRLATYQHTGFWQSMDTYREMKLLNDMWARGDAPWHLWQECRLSA